MNQAGTVPGVPAGGTQAAAAGGLTGRATPVPALLNGGLSADLFVPDAATLPPGAAFHLGRWEIGRYVAVVSAGLRRIVVTDRPPAPRLTGGRSVTMADGDDADLARTPRGRALDRAAAGEAHGRSPPVRSARASCR
jgi:hypothetical protein